MEINDLTDAQREAFKKVEADLGQVELQLRKVYGEARSRLSAVGLHQDVEGFPCLLCGCPGYEWEARAPRPCARQSCRHKFIAHDFIGSTAT